jgi:hypothetical protein
VNLPPSVAASSIVIATPSGSQPPRSRLIRTVAGETARVPTVYARFSGPK